MSTHYKLFINALAKPRAGRRTEMGLLASPSSPPPPDALGHPSVTFVDSRICGRVKCFVGGVSLDTRAEILGTHVLREVQLRRSDGDEGPSHEEGKGVRLRPVCGPEGRRTRAQRHRSCHRRTHGRRFLRCPNSCRR